MIWYYFDMSIVELLFKNQDLKYREFTLKLTPNLDYNSVIGVRVPILKRIVKNLTFEEKRTFINDLPHKYFEEDMIHAIILSDYSNDIDEVILKIKEFLPYMNSWNVTDSLKPKIFKKYSNEVFVFLKEVIQNENIYSVRYGIVSMLYFYLDDNFNDDVLNVILDIDSDEYYIKMALAWFYSFGLIKHYEVFIKIFEKKNLDKWVHNKSIQKAIESYRISEDKKNYLRSLRTK